MNKNPSITIRIVDIVGSANCVDAADGQKLHTVIYENLRKSNSVTLSFEGVDRITTAFLNSAVGQLYGDLTEEQIRRGLRFIDVRPISADALARVIERAKRFFTNPEPYNEATKNITEE